MRHMSSPAPVSMLMICVCGISLVALDALINTYNMFMVLLLNTPGISHIVKAIILN